MSIAPNDIISETWVKHGCDAPVDKVCLRCRAPRRDTSSFYCATCRQDFREAEARSAEASALETFRLKHPQGTYYAEQLAQLDDLATERRYIPEPLPSAGTITREGSPVRTFATGANRDTDAGKFDYEAFLSPLVIERYGAYMHKNRQLADGSLRDGDNWQKGLPVETYRKSLWRHFLAAWRRWRGWDQTDEQEHLCGVLFNTMGLLHELLKKDRHD